MSQATPTIGPGETGTSYRGKDTDGKKAANTAHKGSSPPSYAEAGYSWIDDSADPLWYRRVFKGGTVADLANWPIAEEIDTTLVATRPRLRRRILSKSAAYTATVADQGAFILADPTAAAFTIKLPAASAAVAGFAIGFRNDGTGNDLTVQRADATSDTIDGATNVTVAPGETLELVLGSGTDWKTAAGSGSADNKKVLVSATDTTEGYLGAKLSATGGIGKATLNGGANEQVQHSLDLASLSALSSLADDDLLVVERADASKRKITKANLFAQILSGAGMPRGWIDGLTLANNGTDANNDIDIAAGAARSDGADADIVLAAGLTKRLDAAWAAGTNQGMLDSGSEAASTWYHLFVIKNPSSGAVDVLASASLSSPTLPSGYTKKRRIGSIYNNASSNIDPFFQYPGGYFVWKDMPVVGNASTAGAAVTIRTPAGLKVRAQLILRVSVPAGGSPPPYEANALVTSLDQTNAGGGTTLTSPAQAAAFRDGAGGTVIGSGEVWMTTDTSSRVRVRNTTAQTANLFTVGWLDPRGIDG